LSNEDKDFRVRGSQVEGEKENAEHEAKLNGEKRASAPAVLGVGIGKLERWGWDLGRNVQGRRFSKIKTKTTGDQR